MSRKRLEAIVRLFPQNGMKLLLQDAANVRELLKILRLEVLDLIDFKRMRLDRTSYVQRDYRHVEADVIMRAPLRRPDQKRGQRRITIYILIEHQSQPDRLMTFRALEYVVQIYKAQMRQWRRSASTKDGHLWQPVLPIVLYTGTRPWPELARMTDLVEMGEQFAAVIPTMSPLFLNVGTLSASTLESSGGGFGWVLRLLQERASGRQEFQNLLHRVVEHLETLAVSERLRWLALLSYVQALVYHERSRDEFAGLQEKIEAFVPMDQDRQEVSAMGKTMADFMMAKGRRKGRKEGEIRARKQVLLRQLRRRFDELPAETIAVVKRTESPEQLDLWLDQVFTAKSLSAMGIG